MLSRAEAGSKIKIVDTPETVHRLTQHPEFERAIARGVHVEALLVQTDDSKLADYARRLDEAYKKDGVEGIANVLMNTMTWQGAPLSREQAMRMAEESAKRVYG